MDLQSNGFGSRSIESDPLEAAGPSSRSGVPAPRRKTSRPTVVVGCDFGTYATKVMLRRRGDAEAHCLAPGRPTDGYARFAFPSLVRLHGDQLYFGSRAATMREGQLYRSLKVRLLGPKAEQELEQYPEGPPPDLLVAAYLAWLLEQVWREIDRRFRGPTVFLNLAAPMDHIENKALKERYLQIIHAAWSLTFSPTTVANGVRLSSVGPLLESLLASPVPPTQERKFDVLPETIAPVVSLSLDPRTTVGNYLVMDMGAGTTEASVCLIGGHGAEQRITCYFDQTDLVGADLFRDADRLIGEVRRERIETLCRRLAKLEKQVWYEGYRKDRSNRATHDRWRRLKVLLAGGGTLRREVSETIRETNPVHHLFSEDCKYEVARHSPIGIGAMPQVQDDLGMLATAHGLTVERMHWPIWFAPIDVEEQPQAEVIQKEEAYWYVK